MVLFLYFYSCPELRDRVLLLQRTAARVADAIDARAPTQWLHRAPPTLAASRNVRALAPGTRPPEALDEKHVATSGNAVNTAQPTHAVAGSSVEGSSSLGRAAGDADGAALAAHDEAAVAQLDLDAAAADVEAAFVAAAQRAAAWEDEAAAEVLSLWACQ